MSRYKKIMLTSGIMQKEVLTSVQRVDPRVDKSLLSKIVNDICLPNKPTLDSICKTLRCDVLDIYDPHEINLLPDNAVCATANTVATARKSRDGLSHGNNIYNLTVEIDRDTANRIFAKSALRKLGYLSRADLVRQAVAAAVKRLDELERQEKAADGAATPIDGKHKSTTH